MPFDALSANASEIVPVGVDIHTPDFLAIARGFGCSACRADTPSTLAAQLRKAMSRSVPTVIEIDEADWFARVVE